MSRLLIMRSLALASALAVAACSGEKAPDASSSAAPSATPPAPSGAATAQPTMPAAAVISRFVPFSTCKAIEVNEDEDWSTSKCAGMAGYSVIIDYGDARDDLRITPKGGKDVTLGLPTLGGGGFNTLGPAFEWRGRGEGAAFAPHALIVRNAVSEDPEHSERQTSLLAVIDLARMCVVALVRPGPGQNARAQAIADQRGEACLTRGD